MLAAASDNPRPSGGEPSGAGLGRGADAVASVPVLILGSAGIAAGVPLMAAGADVIDESAAAPELAFGVGSVQATWKLR